MHPEILSQAKKPFTFGFSISREKKSFIFRHLCLRASGDLSKGEMLYNSHFSPGWRKFPEPKEKQCHRCEPMHLLAQKVYNLCHVIKTLKAQPAESLALYLLMMAGQCD